MSAVFRYPSSLPLLAILVAGVLAAGCGDREAGEATPTPGASPAATAATAQPTPPSTPAEPPTATATPTTTPEAPLPIPTSAPEDAPPLIGEVTGWFVEPRPDGEVQVRTIGPRPSSPFAPREGGSTEVVLYDVETMTERSLGQGGYASFSPDGSMLAWVTGAVPHRWDEIRVLDLATGDERSLGRARTLRWVDDSTLAVHVQGNETALVDIETGAASPVGDVSLGYIERPVEAAGYRLERVL